jgi:hypothetical protein
LTEHFRFSTASVLREFAGSAKICSVHCKGSDVRWIAAKVQGSRGPIIISSHRPISRLCVSSSYCPLGSCATINHFAVKDCDMDEVNHFKEQGNVKLTVPLAPGFEKVLFDLVQITAIKSGFDRSFSRRIAEQVSHKIFHRIQPGTNQKNHQLVEVNMFHCPGEISVRSEISGSNFNEELQFKAAESG